MPVDSTHVDHDRDTTAGDAHALAAEMPWHTVKTWLEEQTLATSSWAVLASVMSSIDLTLAIALAPVMVR